MHILLCLITVIILLCDKWIENLNATISFVHNLTYILLIVELTQRLHLLDLVVPGSGPMTDDTISHQPWWYHTYTTWINHIDQECEVFKAGGNLCNKSYILKNIYNKNEYILFSALRMIVQEVALPKCARDECCMRIQALVCFKPFNFQYLLMQIIMSY